MADKAQKPFHEELRKTMDEFVHGVYDATETFPKHEVFGLTSQLRRAALSVPLNYVEGYARQRTAVLKNFLEISYGSLKESKYLIEFSNRRGYISDAQYQKLVDLSDKIGRMLWGTLSKLEP